MLMVLAVYPHHLFMDYANPTWASVLGQVLSYTSSLPVLGGDGGRDARERLSLGHEVERDGVAPLRLRSWGGASACPGGRRRDDRDQPRDAQHALGPRTLPHVSVARRRRDAVRVHVFPRRVRTGASDSALDRAALLDVRRRRHGVRIVVPRGGRDERSAAMGGARRIRGWRSTGSARLFALVSSPARSCSS